MIPNYNQVINKYYPEGTPLRDIYLRHCSSVAQLALQINNERNLGLDPHTVRTAAMLHDIGILLTSAPGIHCLGHEPYICHGILGAQLLRNEGLPETIARIAQCHTGAGITSADIQELNLPLPPGDYMPHTILERLICYADKFYSKTRLDSPKPLEAVRSSMLRHSPATLARFDALHAEFAAPSANLS